MPIHSARIVRALYRTQASIPSTNGASFHLPAASSPLPTLLTTTPTLTFEDLGVSHPLTATLARRGVTVPLPIQAHAIPDALAGRDVLGKAETGSGKTLAFGLPLLDRLAVAGGAPGARGARGARGVPGARGARPRALVLVPTRELARQVHDELAPLARAVGLRPLAVYGGASMGAQARALRAGVELVVATPGRLTDLLRQGACSLDAVEVTVLDEADHMADIGFLPAVTWLLDRVPSGGQRLLFSATLDNGVDVLVDRYLDNPVRHSVPSATGNLERMDHRSIAVTGDNKVTVAAGLAAGRGRTLLFVRTRHGAARLARQLGRAGIRAEALHGDMAQGARDRALAAFSGGRAPVLVATDVAARGIHVDAVDLVVHFDPPVEAKTYLHRSGRTARAGAAGSVVTLVLPEQAAEVAKLLHRAGVGPDAPPSGRRRAASHREGSPARQRRAPRPVGGRRRPRRRSAQTPVDQGPGKRAERIW
jgi:superfamily II DNA/RNA helicase